MRGGVALGLMLLALGAASGRGQLLEEAAREKSLEGVKIRLLDLRWGTAGEVAPERGMPGERGLLVRYDMIAPPRMALPSIQCLSPEGQPLSTGTQIGRSGPAHTTFWSNFDPRQKSALLRFEWLSAQAPPGADGQFEETLTFPEVPLPRAADTVEPLKLEAQSRLGVRVRLEKIALRPKRGNGGQVAIVFQWFPPSDHLDSRVSVAADLDRTVDDRGGRFDYPGWASSDELAPPAEMIRPRFPRETLTFSALPAPGARSLSLALKIRGTSPRQERWYRRLDFPVSLANLPMPAKIPAVSVVSVKSASFQGEVEQASKDLSNQDAFRLWVRPLPGRAGQEVEFVVEDRTIRDQEDTLYPLFPYAWSPNWRADGTPAPSGARGEAFGLGRSSVPAGTRLTLSAAVRPVRRRLRPFSLKNVPIPAPGQTVQVNRTARDASGGQLTLVRVAHFVAAAPEGWEEGFGQLRLPQGLAFTFEYAPPGAERGGQVNFSRIEVQDAREQRLGLVAHRSAPAAEPLSGRSVLTPPARPGAGSLAVRVQVEDVVPIGPVERLEFPNILSR